MEKALFDRKHGWIQTFKRHKFWPLNPRLQDIDIEDIAHGLAGEGRFTNQIKSVYSVAQHSCMVSWLLRDWGAGIMVQFQGLMHDADEAYLPDLARPVKHQRFMEPYRRAGKRLQRLIFRKYGLPINELPIVKAADSYLLSIEAQQLFKGGPLPGWWRKLDKVNSSIKILVLDHDTAEQTFLEEFKRLRRLFAEESKERSRLARQRRTKLLAA